ncbi:MAG: glycoside hydrolase family 130 protein [Parachlamydia sp.]|nr:glycoside hydrolase family 130 protein [Parachlamydia sp.]
MVHAALALFFFILSPFQVFGWEIGPFHRADEVNPVISPKRSSTFSCPLAKGFIRWESDHTFNPGAVVHKGKVYLIYRAEDDSGLGIGQHTSRLGLAVSDDGWHFKRKGTPVLFPNCDDQEEHEWAGGCEDPRIVQGKDGTFVMTYTQWNRKIAVLAVATSRNLYSWKKHGYIFEKADQGRFGRRWSKSGAIVTSLEGDHLVATKIQGKYWMYWGEGSIFAATSEDLIAWEPVLDEEGNPIPILNPRPFHFDSALVESGPPAILTEDGIVLLYNGKNDFERGYPGICPGAYAAGQVLMDASDPMKLIDRLPEPFFKPERPYETSGQYQDGTVFIQGLVHFKDRWFLYYGAADSAIGMALDSGL